MSNEWKEFAIEGMLGEDGENVEEKINEWFFDGFVYLFEEVTWQSAINNGFIRVR